MKKYLFAVAVGSALFAGCSSVPAPQNPADYQVESQNDSMMKDADAMGEETMMNEDATAEISKSTELNDIESELQGTTISEEDFSDL